MCSDRVRSMNRWLTARPAARTPHTTRTRRGHTLLELLIAVALGLLVTGGAAAMYRAQRAAFARADDAAQIREAGLAALMMIGQQVQMAGFQPLDTTPVAAAPSVFGCSGARPVGADNAMSCEALSSHSDGIALRYVGDVVSTWASTAGLATDCLGQGVADISGSGDAGQGVAIVNRFFAKASGSTGEPELYCEGSGRSNSAQPLVEGVEKLRVRYWLDGASAATDASGIGLAQWNSVVAVDVCVQVRGAPVWKRMRYVDCDGAALVGSDMRARRVFWRHIAIRNNEGART